MRVLPLALALLLFAPTLSGCFDKDDEVLAKPTDTPVVVPTSRPTPPRPAVFNTSDPGYRVETPWTIGDGWDYESNRSHVKRVRVLDLRLMNGSQKFLLETTDLDDKGSVQRVARSWVDPRGWLLLNDTIESGAGDRYQPGMPLRFWRNSTVTFDHARLGPGGTTASNETITIFARLFPTHQTLLFRWGYVEAKRVEHLVVTKQPDGTRAEKTLVHWVHKDYLNDVQFQTADGELYTLVAARAGEFRRGQLA